MTGEPVRIKRYPNRRYYARETSEYVSLKQIEAMIQEGKTVEIVDSQSGEDLTRAVLAQIIMERQPDKMTLFPVDMLHCIVRSNDMMSEFLRDYFRHSLTYLEYLQRHSASAASLPGPMHWVKAWLDGIAPGPESNSQVNAEGAGERTAETGEDQSKLADRVAQLEERLRQLEADDAKHQL